MIVVEPPAMLSVSMVGFVQAGMMIGLEHPKFATFFVSTGRAAEKLAEWGKGFMEAVEGALQEASAGSSIGHLQMC